MRTPITFLIFNRPETTAKVLEAIRQARPPKLLVVADGPRSNHPGEEEKCRATRALIDQVDWDCEILKNYSDINLGCKKRISSGLNWIFSIIDEAIILEDDCFPDPTFFRYCDELLERYRHSYQVMAINGQNLQFGRERGKESYYFSRYFHSWGWATWKRAWQFFDVDMKVWDLVPDWESKLLDMFPCQRHADYWKGIFQAVHDGRINSWAYQWFFAIWAANGLVTTPRVNLVKNIGFGKDATHTECDARRNIYAEMSINSLRFPLSHPHIYFPSRIADEFTQETHYNPSFMTRLRCKLNRMIGLNQI